MSEADEDTILIVEETDDGKAIRLTLTTKSGRRLGMEEFLLEVEAYAKEVLRAEETRNQPGTQTH